VKGAASSGPGGCQVARKGRPSRRLSQSSAEQARPEVGRSGPGHTPGVPLENLPEESRPSGDLIASAKELDTHYIPTPYPDGFERGARSISARGARPSRPSPVRRESLNGVVVKSVDEGAVRRAMDAHAARLLAAHPEVEEIVVFGSFAAGAWAPRSDLDVFIVLSHSVTSVRDRIPDLPAGPLFRRCRPLPVHEAGDRCTRAVSAHRRRCAEPLAPWPPRITPTGP